MTGLTCTSTQQGESLNVQDALLKMQQAVRKGELQQAAVIGASAEIPLSIRLDELSLLGEIASGAEATVLYGSLNNTDVAVKRFKMHHSDDLKRFRRELSILASLAPHPNIVPVLGARALPPDYLLIMPLAAATLHSKLYQLGWRPNTLELLHLAVQAAEGLAAVHAKGLVHRDIKPSNMLVGFEGQLWLSDFGLAATVEEVVQESTLSIGMLRSRGKPTGGFLKRAMQGTLEYMAPEQLQKQPASQASDVYALAVTINELATGVYPFSDCTKDNPEIHTVLEHGYGRQELAAAVAAEGLRPSVPKTAPEGLVQLLQAAWHLNPAARPTAAQMRAALAALLQQQQQQTAVQCGYAESCEPHTAMDVDKLADVVQGLSRCSSRIGFSVPVSSAATSVTDDSRAQQEDGDSETLGDSDDMAVNPTSSSSARGRLQGSSASAGLSYQQQHGTGVSGRSSWLTGGRLMRVPHGSVSTVSTDVTGFNTAGDISSAKPLSTEVANAAAAAAASAAVPAGAAQQGVLNLIADDCTPQQGLAVVTAGSFGALGPRESMEDCHVVVQGLGGDDRIMLAAVFDGHRGHEAATYAASQLPRNLMLASVQVAGQQQQLAAAAAAAEQPAAVDSSTAAAVLKQAFLSTDAAFWQEWQAEMHAHAVVGQYSERYPGSTALAAVIAGSSLLVANAGDGRAVLSRSGTAVPLSRQHTADLADERSRVLAAGGTVSYRGGSWRVGPAALQVTRAFGDFDLKQPCQQQQRQYDQAVQPVLPGQLSGPVCLMGVRSPYHSCTVMQPASSTVSSSNDGAAESCSIASGSTAAKALLMPVTAEPEVVSVRITSRDQFLVLGTDGLWDVITDQEAVGLVHDTVKDPALCAKRLVQEALARGSTDNVTAVVVFLQPKHTLERVWVRGGDSGVPAVTPTFYGSRRMTTKQLEEVAGSSTAAAAAPAGAADEVMDTY